MARSYKRTALYALSVAYPLRRQPDLLCKRQHPLYRQHRPRNDGRIDMYLIPAGFKNLSQIQQPVHRHPRAMRAALAGRAVAGGRRFDEASCAGTAVRIWCRMPLSVATMNSCASSVCDGLDQLRGRADHVGQLRPPLRGDSGCTSTFARGCCAFSRSSSMALNSSCTMHEPCHSSMSAPVCSWM